MARWGLCWGVLFAAGAGAALGRLERAAVWLGWCVFVLFAWGAVMAVYAFDRPAPRV